MAQTKVKICIKKPITFLVQIFSRKKKRKKKEIRLLEYCAWKKKKEINMFICKKIIFVYSANTFNFFLLWKSFHWSLWVSYCSRFVLHQHCNVVGKGGCCTLFVLVRAILFFEFQHKSIIFKQIGQPCTIQPFLLSRLFRYFFHKSFQRADFEAHLITKNKIK